MCWTSRGGGSKVNLAVFRKTRTDAWYFQSEGLSGIDSGHMMLVVCDSSVHPSIVLVIPKVFLPIDYALFAATSIDLMVTENLFKNKLPRLQAPLGRMIVLISQKLPSFDYHKMHSSQFQHSSTHLHPTASFPFPLPSPSPPSLYPLPNSRPACFIHMSHRTPH